MKDILSKIIGFVIIFVIAVMVISRVINRGSTDMTVDMSPASLPVVSVMTQNGNINKLYGYTGDTDISKIRGSLTPLKENRGLDIHVRKYNAGIRGMYYEVRSPDGQRLVERTDILDYKEQNDEIDASIAVKDLIDEDTEYCLCIGFSDDNGRDVRYYTRIIYNNGYKVEEQTDFVRQFTRATFNKDDAASITMYLESNEMGDNTNFAHVNIHSSLDQITWGQLHPELISDMDITVYDMNESGGFFGNSYYVEAGPTDGRHEYKIEEFFRLRYTEERIYLLDFERTMTEIFVPDKDHFANDKIMMGITDSGVDFMENNDGDIVAFIQNGALYCYRGINNRVVRVFSFFDDENNDERTRLNEHDIRLLSVDEGGNIRFLVYGYMNRGRHEGEVCAGVYYYDSALNTIEEEVTIPYNGSFSSLRSNLDLLSYEDRSNNFYFYLSGSIYRIRMGSARTEVVSSGIGVDDFVVSESMGVVAWTDELIRVGAAETIGASHDSSEITLLNLSNGSRRLIKSDAGRITIPIGFVGEDFVYGVSDSGGVIRTASGTERILMKYLYIENTAGEILKEYDAGSKYISDVKIEGSTISLSKILMDEEGLVILSESDQIMSSGTGKDTLTDIILVSTEERETIVELQVYQDITTDSLQLLTPKEVLFEGGRTVNIDSDGQWQDDNYIVYARGRISGIFGNLSQAIEKAGEDTGVVVSSGDKKYAWSRLGKKSEYSININENIEYSGNDMADCLNAMLEYEGKSVDVAALLNAGNSPLSILRNNMDKTILNPEGCSMEDILYYVSEDHPVLAPSRTQTLLIVGYDAKNIIVFDPSEQRIHKMGMNDSHDLFESRGNEFISYMD